jgi:hypothetical protein
MTQLNLFEQRNVTGRVSEVVVGRITFAPPPLPDMLGQPPAVNVPTSLAAADAIKPTADTLRRLVLDFLVLSGKYGATDEEMQLALGMPGNTQRPRRVELAHAGHIVMAPEMRRTRAGRLANVWRAVNTQEGE